MGLLRDVGAIWPIPTVFVKIKSYGNCRVIFVVIWRGVSGDMTDETCEVAPVMPWYGLATLAASSLRGESLKSNVHSPPLMEASRLERGAGRGVWGEIAGHERTATEARCRRHRTDERSISGCSASTRPNAPIDIRSSPVRRTAKAATLLKWNIGRLHARCKASSARGESRSRPVVHPSGETKKVSTIHIWTYWSG